MAKKLNARRSAKLMTEEMYRHSSRDFFFRKGDVGITMHGDGKNGVVFSRLVGSLGNRTEDFKETIDYKEAANRIEELLKENYELPAMDARFLV